MTDALLEMRRESERDGGGAYIYIETSNVATINMYNASRYCWAYTTEIDLT